jgi:hypothetical protein
MCQNHYRIIILKSYKSSVISYLEFHFRKSPATIALATSSIILSFPDFVYHFSHNPTLLFVFRLWGSVATFIRAYLDLSHSSASTFKVAGITDMYHRP